MKTKTLDCKHGTFTIFSDDEFVGRSLEAYGEFSEDEVSVFDKVLSGDDIAIEVGSNIGALTVPMARRCRKVYAFEPQPDNFSMLLRNLKDNNLGNVETGNCALGSRCGITHIPYLDSLGHHNYGRVEVGDSGCTVTMQRLDDMIDADDRIKFIKIDVEGHELEVLKGAAGIIMRDRPVLYVENDRPDQSNDLIGWLVDHGYRPFWHQPPLFYNGNFRKNPRNVWGRNIVSVNMVCVPEESRYKIERLEEVHDPRIDSSMHAREHTRLMARLNRDPDDLEARVNAAHFANLDGDAVKARALMAENLALDPDHLGTLTLKGLFDLQDANFAEGWPAYELRYRRHETIGHQFGFRTDEKPHWDGQPTDKVVLIHSEQGFGDSILFVRFMDVVMERAPNAILTVQPQLFELFETSNVPCKRLYRQGRILPAYDLHCSLPSLPATLGLNCEDQVVYGSYLKADPAMIDIWRKRQGPRVGVCLKGGAASERGYSRDMPEAAIEPLIETFGQWLALDHTGQWESFADSAAAMASLDLVLSVDTSVAHLAGALGIPTYLMLSSDPDWRWQLGRQDSPWYPSMKIFRQRCFMDWSNVVEEITRVGSLSKKAA